MVCLLLCRHMPILWNTTLPMQLLGELSTICIISMELLKRVFLHVCVCVCVCILSCWVLYVIDSCEIHFSAGPWLVEVLQRGQHDTAIRCLQAMQFITLKLCAIPGSKWLIGINFLSAWLQAVLCWRHRCCGKRCKLCTIYRSQQSSGQTNRVELYLEVCGWIYFFDIFSAFSSGGCEYQCSWRWCPFQACRTTW